MSGKSGEQWATVRNMIDVYRPNMTGLFTLYTSMILIHLYTGKHQMTRYGDQAVPPPLPATATAAQIAARKKSLGVVFRNWHPGPLGFQVVADGLLYYYTAAMLRALDR